MTTETVAPTTVLDGVDAVRAAAGTHLGTSRWLVVDQARVDRFVEATGDPDHTYLVLSLTNGLLPEVVEVRGVSMGLNLGTNQVRFPAPVPVGSRVRIDVAARPTSRDVDGRRADHHDRDRRARGWRRTRRRRRGPQPLPHLTRPRPHNEL